MAMNKRAGNMYEFVTHTWNAIKGRCYHDCSYCYMKRWGGLRDTRFDDGELKTSLGDGNFIFIGSSCDMWNTDIPAEWISKTLDHCIKYPGSRYLFQTKNPARLTEFMDQLSIINPVVCTTIETNRHYPEIMNQSPIIGERVRGMMEIPFDRYVTIEPILDFDVDELVEIIRVIEPKQVNIGADSCGHKLPEPSIEKIHELVDRIKDFTVIENKRNLNRLSRG